LQYIDNYLTEVQNRLPYTAKLKNQVIDDFKADVFTAYEHQESWVSPTNIFGYSDEAARNIAASVDWNTTPAGWWRRILAFTIDSLLLFSIYILLFIAFGLTLNGKLEENGESNLVDIVFGITILILFVGFLMAIAAGYWIAAEKIYGKTPGKKLFGLIVVDQSGIKMNWEQSIVRNLTKIVGEFLFFDFLLGVVMENDPDKSQRAMDVLAKTEVLKL
jgi:uncharacterized RDD family membrane protein YckC